MPRLKIGGYGGVVIEAGDGSLVLGKPHAWGKVMPMIRNLMRT